MVALAATRTAPVTRRALSPERSWLRAFRNRLRVTDLIVVLAAIGCTFWADDIAHSWVDGDGLPVLLTGVGTGIAWLFFLAAQHTRDLRVLGSGTAEYRRVVGATLLCFGLIAVVVVVSGIPWSRTYFLVALPVGFAGLAADRWLWRQWLSRQRADGHYLSSAIVAGRPNDIAYVTRQIDKAGASYRIVDTTPIDDVDAVAATARERGADVVIVASTPSDEGETVRRIAWALEGSATELVLAARLTDVAGPRIHFRPVEGLPLMHVELPQFEGGKHYLKRAFDLVMSLGAVALTAPLIGILCIVIRLDSAGTPIFRQVRVGRDGQAFTMYKLRTMYTGADAKLAELREQNEGAGPMFKMHDDPRVTRVGRWLRKFSLDELPQLWNVLGGRMSLVGPRPPLPTEVEQYAPSVHRRLYIKPGLTGMWQINGRSDLAWEEGVRLDLYYVENWSLTGDLVILWRTVMVLIRPIGAY